MSNPPPPQFFETEVPTDHPGFARCFDKARPSPISPTPEMFNHNPQKGVRLLIPSDARPSAKYIATGPVSFSGEGVPFVRPQIGNMLPLAKALGLERDGGWMDVWKTMGEVKERERLCKLVWAVLEWANEGNSGNTYTYCFCTKYLPSIVHAVIDEPSPSPFASPYDLILRGVANTPLLGFYLRSRPDQAIKLRNVYYRKTLGASDAAKLLNDTQLFTLVMPNLFVLHTAVVSYLSSPLSTPSQRAPPLPLPLTSVPTLQPLLVRLNAVMESEEFIRPKTYFWAGQVEDNFFVFSAGLVHRDLLARFPEIVDAATTPAAIDYVACGMFRCENGFASVEQFLDPKIKGISCEERDPKKLKACARCKTVRYCSTEHQSLDWKHGKHKPFCQPILWDEDDA